MRRARQPVRRSHHGHQGGGHEGGRVGVRQPRPGGRRRDRGGGEAQARRGRGRRRGDGPGVHPRVEVRAFHPFCGGFYPRGGRTAGGGRAGRRLPRERHHRKRQEVHPGRAMLNPHGGARGIVRGEASHRRRAQTPRVHRQRQARGQLLTRGEAHGAFHRRLWRRAGGAGDARGRPQSRRGEGRRGGRDLRVRAPHRGRVGAHGGQARGEAVQGCHQVRRVAGPGQAGGRQRRREARRSARHIRRRRRARRRQFARWKWMGGLQVATGSGGDTGWPRRARAIRRICTGQPGKATDWSEAPGETVEAEPRRHDKGGGIGAAAPHHTADARYYRRNTHQVGETRRPRPPPFVLIPLRRGVDDGREGASVPGCR